MLPLSQSKNSSMQNDSFPDKKNPQGKSHKGYADGSHSEIEVAAYSKWSAEEILDRGMSLVAFMEHKI